MEEHRIEEIYEGGGVSKIETWSFDGLYHRENGPASIRYDENGVKRQEIWFKNGYKHNEKGPAYILYDFAGRKIIEQYYIDNKNHREDGPCIIDYRPDGTILRMSWIYKNLKHRIGGPAYIFKHNKDCESEEYWIYGKEIKWKKYDKIMYLFKNKVQKYKNKKKLELTKKLYKCLNKDISYLVGNYVY